MANENVVNVTVLREWEQVRGLRVAVTETVAQPRTISVAILDTFEGWTEVVQVDSADPGARARAISLAEIIHDVLEVAELTWFDPVTDEAP